MLCDGTLAGIFGRSDVLPDISLLERDLPPESWRNDCLPSLSGYTR
jgi:polar amino acid transport system substrate-binding protein